MSLKGDVAGGEKRRKVMVAMDESEESLYALSWCLSNIVNGNCQDALLILHAKRPTLLYPGLDDSAYVFSHDVVASLERRDNDIAHLVIEKAEKLCKEHDVKMEGIIENGDPRQVICDMVKALGADLLVMGSHGYGLITRTLLGSVSNHCVQNASCPVLVVKMPRSSASESTTK